MNSSKTYDYLIIGQGIAGTMLAHFLLKKNKSIRITDQSNPSSSSHIAAGICNPITGQRLVKTWNADVIFPFAEAVYSELEHDFGSKFWHKMNIVKVLSTKEALFYNEKRNNSEFQKWTIPVQRNFSTQQFHGDFEITGSGYLNMDKLITAYSQKFLQKNILLEGCCQPEDLQIEKEYILWKGYRFQKVIFCEGYQAANNPFFSWLPFVLAKGELLEIHSPGLQLNKILMKDIFILPTGNNYYKVGSTYEWNNLNEEPTEERKAELINKLKQLIHCSYSIVNHYAGIRPTVKDRKPLLGLHPQHQQIGIFNGLGSKGASLAPYLASHFADYLENEVSLSKEVDISRFIKTKNIVISPSECNTSQ
jgi:glycine/D-amino acid oxidase-like deaminating enzyme